MGHNVRHHRQTLRCSDTERGDMVYNSQILGETRTLNRNKNIPPLCQSAHTRPYQISRAGSKQQAPHGAPETTRHSTTKSTHLQKTFPQMELIPRNSANGGALGTLLSITELYEARSSSYFSALPETTMQFRQTCTKCFLETCERKICGGNI